MKRRSFLWGCLFVSLLILLLAGIGGWLFVRPRFQTSTAPPPSPMLVFLLSPSSGDEMEVGDYVPVNLRVIAPTAIQSVELFVDGQSLGAVSDSPENASWTWQAWPVGIHTMSTRATAADGQVGQSQTVIVNVLAGNGSFQIPAQDGQTLQQIGADYGIPPDQMAGANPDIDPSQPLTDGQPVNVPVPSGDNPGGGPNPPGGGNSGGGGAGNGSEQGSGNNPFLISIIWDFKLTEPVDKSYCYVSTGNGIWEKMPKPPFDFFEALNNSYTQFFPQKLSIIQMQCWGWLGDALKFLGQGETKFDFLHPPEKVTISAQGFQFTGIPQIPMSYGGGPNWGVPPPYALREPMNAADCTAHSHPLLAPFICNTILSAPLKQNIILEWEWQAPALCWPGYCSWVQAIDGYRIYEIDPVTKAEKYLKEVNNPNQKIALIPLPWGSPCYGVRAYANNPAYMESEIDTYCPGETPNVQKTTLYPIAWVTNGGTQWQDGDCSTAGGLELPVYYNNQTGFGNGLGEILVGRYIMDEDCFQSGAYAGGVKFGLGSLPTGSVIQKAILKFSKVFMEYGATGVAVGAKPASCAESVRKATQDWSGLGSAIHFWETEHSLPLAGGAYSTPIASISAYMSPNVDVTAAVNDWIKHPANNHGLILTPMASPQPTEDGTGECLSGLGNFTLDVYYFAP